MNNQKELKRIEDKLSIYLATDRRNWTETYLLMKEVRDKELLEISQKYVAQGWEILLVDENKNITVAREAAKRECLFRQETLTEAVIHS